MNDDDDGDSDGDDDGDGDGDGDDDGDATILIINFDVASRVIMLNTSAFDMQIKTKGFWVLKQKGFGY